VSSQPASDGFAGRAGLVTGAASGIGRESAIRLAGAGAAVAVIDVDEPGGHETVEIIRAAGGEASFVLCDITTAADVGRVVEHVVTRYGRLDFAHNNAGVTAAPRRFDEVTADDWDRVVLVNLKGTWLCMKYELAAMRRQDSGAIVNTASVCGIRAIAMSSPYNATKHGVIGMTKEAAVEFAELGIRVNAVCPGYVDTPMTRHGSTKQAWARVARMIPTGRVAAAKEIAEVVTWLLSDAASYVTGHALVADGGLSQTIPGSR
jgi:NAD(P)-dependent dehydrogenase (short-subunit alcohol dehydrogenase family)